MSGEGEFPVDSPRMHFDVSQRTEQVSDRVLGDMIQLLIHKAVITESEGNVMLQKLFK